MADGDPALFSARRKFNDPKTTLCGAERARVAFSHLETLWVNTGAQCNIECTNCYIESSPSNDRLTYISQKELAPFLVEAAEMGAREIGFTGGEPFLNPDIIAMAEDALSTGFEVLILTNAMRPVMRPSVRAPLRALQARFGAKLKLRISLDHYTPQLHDKERGAGSFAIALAGMKALAEDGHNITIAGRSIYEENETTARAGYAALFAEHRLPNNMHQPEQLVLFPEMDETAETPEITTDCWDILGKSPKDVMCASSRMVVKRKGAKKPVVLACTLLAYDPRFELGETIAEAAKPVALNHPHCSKFCVLGGASCSG